MRAAKARHDPLVALTHPGVAGAASGERDLRLVGSLQPLLHKGFRGMDYAAMLYRWTLANELIRAHDDMRILAGVDRSTVLDQTRCSDLDKEWDRINGREAPTVDYDPSRFDAPVEISPGAWIEVVD